MLNRTLFDNAAPAGHPLIEVVGPAEGKGGIGARFVPLRRTLLRGQVTGPLAALTVEQEFGFGGELAPALATAVLEARYRFPLPGDAAVQGVSVRFGDVEIVAELLARADAQAAYAEASAEGRQAALATREAPDVFTLQLSGLKAGEPITVITRFVQLAQHDGAEYVLRLPLTTAPRFVREDDRNTPAGNAAPYAILRDPGHRAALDVVVRGAVTVRSSTHALALEAAGEGGALRVRLAAGDVLPDRDLLLHFAAAASTTPALRLWTHQEGDDAGGELYLLAEVMAPQQPQPAQQGVTREVVLLVDHSGSMMGPKWEAADWAVERFLRDLKPHDQFALGVFHDNTHWFRAEAAAAEVQTVESAVRWFKAQHDNGGTQLGVALEQALQLDRAGDGSAEGARSRHLLVITDAEVTDAGRILRLADVEACMEPELRRRISVLCIDAAPNAWLATELADRGGGSAHFLTSSPEATDISTALDTILAEFAAPVLVGAALLLNRQQALGSLAEAARSSDGAALDVGDLPAGRRRWIAARVPAAGALLQARLVTQQGVQAAAHAEALDVASFGPALKALFGARRINALEALSTGRFEAAEVAEALQRMGYDPAQAALAPKGRASIYAETQAAQTAAALEQLLRAESLRYGLASSAVGFVATRREAGKPVTQQVAVANALPAGWSDRFLTGGAPKMAMAAAPMLVDLNAPGVLFQRGRAARSFRGRGDQPMTHRLSAAFEDAPAPPSSGSALLFSGAPDGGTRVLFDSAADGSAALPHQTTFLALLLESAATARIGAPPLEGVLLLYVGDLAQPRARVRLSDLARSGRRPLNIRRNPGDVVRLVLESTGPLPPLAIRLAW